MPEADSRRFPLAGVRIADLTQVIAGPVSTRVLAQLGAQVIKVESPWGRRMAPSRSGADQPRLYNRAANFNEVNRAKLSTAINLSHEAGRDVFRRLVSISDVVIENYSPRVMGNLGLSYDALRKIRPDIIMVSMPAMGASGPWANYISFGPGTDALAGLSDVTGYEGGPPHKPGNFYADQNSAYHVTFAIMLALRHRRRTGQGQHIEIVLREATMSIIGEFFLEYQLTGRNPQRMGSHHPSMAPHNVYRCLGEDAWAVIAVASDDEWLRLCQALGDPDWCRDERFASGLNRWHHQRELDGLIEGWTRERTPYQVMDTLQGHGVRAGAVLKAPETMEDPHWKERRFIDYTDHPDAGPAQHPGLPMHFSRAPVNVGQRAPMFAEHSDWLLEELLSLSDGEISRLREGKIMPSEPVNVEP